LFDLTFIVHLSVSDSSPPSSPFFPPVKTRDVKGGEDEEREEREEMSRGETHNVRHTHTTKEGPQESDVKKNVEEGGKEERRIGEEERRREGEEERRGRRGRGRRGSLMRADLWEGEPQRA
jgi:hypothetical protein